MKSGIAAREFPQAGTSPQPPLRFPKQREVQKRRSVEASVPERANSECRLGKRQDFPEWVGRKGRPMAGWNDPAAGFPEGREIPGYEGATPGLITGYKIFQSAVSMKLAALSSANA